MGSVLFLWFPMFSLWSSYMFPMFLLWFSYGHPICFLLFPYGFLMVSLWLFIVSYAFPIVSLSLFKKYCLTINKKSTNYVVGSVLFLWFPMFSLWSSYVFPMFLLWFYYGFLMAFLWFPMLSNCFHMVFQWFSYSSFKKSCLAFNKKIK